MEEVSVLSPSGKTIAIWDPETKLLVVKDNPDSYIQRGMVERSHTFHCTELVGMKLSDDDNLTFVGKLRFSTSIVSMTHASWNLSEDLPTIAPAIDSFEPVSVSFARGYETAFACLGWHYKEGRRTGQLIVIKTSLEKKELWCDKAIIRSLTFKYSERGYVLILKLRTGWFRTVTMVMDITDIG